MVQCSIKQGYKEKREKTSLPASAGGQED